MKNNTTASVPLGGAFWDGGTQKFTHRDPNGLWREILNPDQVAK